MDNKVRPIAIHLPQFHPIPENDLWWGKGFTEWTNVTKAKPKFKGHYQPHLAADLGFYDLRLAESRSAQAALAKSYGIEGFCYYHYWFNGKRLLNRPLDDIIALKEPDFPFMICWANENWTRRWDGADQEILIEQKYDEDDDISHIDFLIEKVFSDNRYIKVDNKPFFLIYRPKLFPNIAKTIEMWRTRAMQAGLDGLYLGYMQSFSFNADPLDTGFDCAVEFHPDFYRLPDAIKPSLSERLAHKLGIASSAHFTEKLFDYGDYVENIKSTDRNTPNVYKGLTPMWDNSARRKKGAYILHNSTPLLYQSWLEHVVDKTLELRHKGNFIFINAWNEWAEGNHLEPCQKWSTAYLEATQNALVKYA